MSSLTTTPTRAEIQSLLTGVLEEMFETDPAAVTPEAHLYDDLDIDSIDAVDLIVRLKEITGKKVSPEAFKSVRTVDDIVTAIQNLLNE